MLLLEKYALADKALMVAVKRAVYSHEMHENSY